MQKSNNKIQAPKEIIFEGFNLKKGKERKKKKREKQERNKKKKDRNRKEKDREKRKKVSLLFSMFVFDLFFPSSPFFR